ncbi:diguanylate cyclase [Gracilibacillus sp. YIM 98692]|uniref:diguanylate cyclase domain-containing protein n=1 Tax=Gracilibacillus sp. YIM 98692 TaxID=2663532 RepID=UPI0013D5EA79|nr:diguanylate cyclase [Gracilibacillus sp. YIM 98692]
MVFRYVELKRLVIFIFMVIFVLYAQLHTIPVLFGFSVSLSLLLFFVMIRFFGLRKAFITSLIICFIDFVLHQQWFIFWSVLEVALIGSLYKRCQKNLFVSAIIYVVFIFFSYLFSLFMYDHLFEETLLTFILLQHILEVLFFALLADMIVDYVPVFIRSKQGERKNKKLHFGHVISQIIIFASITPLIIIIFVHAQMMENQIYSQMRMNHERIKEQINNWVSDMDAVDRQEYTQESDIAKTQLKSKLDDYTGRLVDHVFVFNQNGEQWITTEDSPDNSLWLEYWEGGYVKEIEKNKYIWLSNNDNMNAWLNALYVGKENILNKPIYFVAPLRDNVLDLASRLNTYYVFTLFVLFMASIFGMLANRILSRALEKLTDLTGDLPNKVQQKYGIPEYHTQIEEFSKVGQNMQHVLKQLQEMFAATNKQNEILTEQTHKLMKSEQELYHLAHFDSLTNLPNRYSFYQDIERRLNIQQSNDKNLFAIMFIDLDQFKQVNDTLGHSGGDLLLKKIADRFMQFVEKHKYVHIYRLAGDEFIAIVDLQTKENVQQISQSLLKRIHQPLFMKGKTLTLSASIGISYFPEDGDTIDAILHKADTKMYHQKVRDRKDNRSSTNE